MTLIEELELPEYEIFVKTLAKRCKLLAEENPDFVYEGLKGYDYKCLYTKGAKGCGCIVGQAIQIEYPKLYEELKLFDRRQSSCRISEARGNDIDGIIRSIYRNTWEKDLTPYRDFLAVIQNQQDKKRSWGEALKEASKELSCIL